MIPSKVDAASRRLAVVTVLLATLGYEADSLLPTVRNIGHISRVVIFYYEDRDGDVLAAVKDAQSALKGMRIPNDRKRLKDGYDYASVTTEIMEAARNIEGGDVAFDVTGGTKIMAFGALTVAWTLGKPAYYNDERKDVEATIQLPIEGLGGGGALSSSCANVLRELVGSAPSPVGLATLVENLGKSPPVLVHHLNTLEARGLAVRDRAGPDRRDVRYLPTASGRLLATIMTPADATPQKKK